MKRIAIEDLADRVADLVATTPREKVLLTRGGEPFAFVSDASIYDWEDIGYMTDPKFWALIEERRKEKQTIPFETILAEIAEQERLEARKPSPRSRVKAGKKKAG